MTRPHGQHGRTSSRWFRLRKEVRARREHCCRCGLPIDYRLEWPHPESFSVDHYRYDLATHPERGEDPGNLHAAHLACNGSGRAALSEPELGSLSEDW